MADMNHPAPRPGEDRLDIRSLVEVLIRRRWIIFGVTLPVVLVALIGTIRSTQMFMARSTLMIEIAGPQRPSFDRINPDYDMVLSAAAELAMSEPVASRAALALADSIPGFRERFPEHLLEMHSVADLQEILHEGVNCTHVGESNLLNLSFSHPDAEFAMIGAGVLTDAFIGFNITGKRNSPAVEYYTEQIAATQGEIDSLMALRTVIIDSTGLVGMQADLKMTFNQIRGLESDYFQARSVRQGIEAKITSIRSAVAANPDFVPAIGTGEAASMNRLKGELDTKLAELASMRQRYNDTSEWVARLNGQIELLREEIVRERDDFVRSLEIDLAEAISIEQSFLNAHETQMHGVADYSKIRDRLETLDLRIDGLRQLLLSLDFKRGEVRLAANSDQRISDVLLIEEPVLDVPVGRGRKLLYLVISIVLALAMGLVAAFFVESNDHRIYDRRRAEMYLEVPVLGSLPDTTVIGRS